MSQSGTLCFRVHVGLVVLRRREACFQDCGVWLYRVECEARSPGGLGGQRVPLGSHRRMETLNLRHAAHKKQRKSSQRDRHLLALHDLENEADGELHLGTLLEGIDQPSTQPHTVPAVHH